MAKFSSSPAKAHLTAVKCIMRYLKGSVDLKLKYERSDDGQFIGYSDADYAGDPNDRHSTTGNVFLMSSGPISWLSKKQGIVTLSTAEAEYVALTMATQEAVWFRRHLSDLKVPQDYPTVLMEDNQGAICIAKNPVSHTRTKRINVRYHYIYIREALSEETIELKYWPTKEMIADIFVKPLHKGRSKVLRTSMNLEPPLPAKLTGSVKESN